MIEFGKIKEIWVGKRILICAYVDDNSNLKSQFFGLFQPDKSNIDMLKIGKGYDNKTNSHLRLAIYKWSIYGYINEKSFVWFGIGFWTDGKEL